MNSRLTFYEEEKRCAGCTLSHSIILVTTFNSVWTLEWPGKTIKEHIHENYTEITFDVAYVASGKHFRPE